MRDIRLDYRIICGIGEEGARVLDLGCGDGELMNILLSEKKARVQGIEIDVKSIYKCVENGLSVFHSDIDSGLPEYPDKSFDYVILNQSLQQAKKVELVLTEALRVGKKVIIGFPNFAHYRARAQLFFKGRAPVTAELPYTWFNSPNIHFLSTIDFVEYARKKNITIERSFYLGTKDLVNVFPNLFALSGLFVLTS